jgi:hypothetical protein
MEACVNLDPVHSIKPIELDRDGFGLVWNSYGAPVAFDLGSALALMATALLFVVL